MNTCGAIFVPPIVNIINALTFMQDYRKYDNDFSISNYEKYNKNKHCQFLERNVYSNEIIKTNVSRRFQ